MIEVKEIEKLSPVEIEYKDMWDGRGAYCGTWRQKIPLIEIQKNMDKGETTVCLLHEIGHAVCDKTKCKCRKIFVETDDIFLPEYHAMKFVLDFLVKHPDKELIKSFNELLTSVKTHKIYDKVVERIRNLKRYKSLTDNHLGKT